MKIRLEKRLDHLIPFDSESESWLLKKHNGQYFEVDIRTPRNYEFHKRFFKLLDKTFPYWKPELKDGIELHFEHYREDLTILSGHFEQYYRLDGSIKTVAKSISFAAMDQEEFERFYSRCVDVILQHVLIGWTVEQVHEYIGSFL